MGSARIASNARICGVDGASARASEGDFAREPSIERTITLRLLRSGLDRLVCIIS